MTPSYLVNVPVTPEQITAMPKVVLHDHLDGGLRPATMIELAAEIGYTLPAQSPEEVATWFVEAASSGSLERYLETFDHTIAVLQTADALERVAYEAVIDLAADGVVYTEQRWAPEQHLREGLSLQDTVEAVGRGLAKGEADVAADGGHIVARQLITAMRHAERSPEIAALSLANRGRYGVVGFDIAGAELGFPPSGHRAAFDALHEAFFPVTIHAGEADGVSSINDALHAGRALRLGHGVRIIEDIDGAAEAIASAGSAEHADMGGLVLGHTAQWVLDRQIPLEVCPSSNLQTGAAPSIAEHAISLLKNLGFAVTVNTDNRLMSGTSMSNEMSLLASACEWTLDDFESATLNAAWNAFIPFDDRANLVEEFILPQFAALREELEN